MVGQKIRHPFTVAVSEKIAVFRTVVIRALPNSQATRSLLILCPMGHTFASALTAWPWTKTFTIVNNSSVTQFERRLRKCNTRVTLCDQSHRHQPVSLRLRPNPF